MRLNKDNPSIREQIDHHLSTQSSFPFRCEFNEDDAARFAKHAPLFWTAWQSGSDIESAASVDYSRLLDARFANRGKMSPDGERVMTELGELRHLFAAADRIRRQADDFAAARFAGSGADRSVWRDAEGNPVRIYRPSERLSEARQSAEVDLGMIVRAMVTGKGLQEINAAMGSGSVSTGGALIPTELATSIIDRMRAESKVIGAGALTFKMPSPTFPMARITGDPTLSWAAESASLSDTAPTFDQVTFTAKTLRGWVLMPRELVEDALGLGDALVQTFSTAMAVELDRVALVGSGTGQEPRGIGAATGAAPIVSMGTNGAQLTNWDKVLDLLDAVLTANAQQPTAMIYAPRTGTTINKFKDTTNQPLQVPPALATIPRLVTTAMPVTQTQGTANNASSIVLGNFAEMMIGVRSELQIIRSESFLSTNQIGMAFVMRADVQWRHAESFAQLRGIIP